MQTAYSRVTVVASDRTIDLALPSALPLSDVLPQLLRFAQLETGGPQRVLSLGRIGGPTLALSQTLQDAGILDGDVLELRDRADEVSLALVEDVRDAVEDTVDAAGGFWSTRTTRSAVVLALSAVLALAAVLAVLAPRIDGLGAFADLDTVPGAALAVSAGLFGTWWAALVARRVDAQVAAGTVLAWAALLGLGIGDLADLPSSWSVLLAAVVTALAATAAWLLTRAATAHLVFAVLGGSLVAVAAGVAAAGLDTLQALRVLGPVAILAIGVLPRVSLSVGGLASADYRVRHVGQLDLATLRARYEASNATLVGSLVALAAIAVASGVVLDVEGSAWDRTLALVLGLALLVRSRIFSRTQHMAVPRAGALVLLVVVALRAILDDTTLLPWAVPILAVVGAAALGVASIPLSEIPRARVKRTLNGAEAVVVVVLLVVAGGALGVYGLVGGWF